jgi:hypothetical protein
MNDELMTPDDVCEPLRATKDRLYDQVQAREGASCCSPAAAIGDSATPECSPTSMPTPSAKMLGQGNEAIEELEWRSMLVS